MVLFALLSELRSFTFVRSVKHVLHARAYINFINYKDVIPFKSDLEGHSFVNEKGEVYQCVVEYSPLQKLPRTKTKKDSRENTIEKGKLRGPNY